MRALVCFPGPDWSVRDVATGHVQGLRALGHEVREYDLSTRLRFYDMACHNAYLRSGKRQPPDVIARLASEKVLIEAVRWGASLVHFVSGMTVHPIAYSDLKRAGFSISLYLTECPYEDGVRQSAIEFVDWLFVNDRSSVEHYRPQCCRTHYLPHAYNPDVHRPVEMGPEYRSDVFLIGTGFPERIRLLESVDWTGIDLRLHGLWELAPGSPLQPFYHPGILPNEEAVRYYSGTKVALNLYRQNAGYGGEAVDGAYSCNPRAYELAACGAFQVSDQRPEVQEIFGDSVATFGTAAELEAQIRQALARPLNRRRMAAEARRRVQPHTFQARMAEMMAVIGGAGQ